MKSKVTDNTLKVTDNILKVTDNILKDIDNIYKVTYNNEISPLATDKGIIRDNLSYCHKYTLR